MKKVLRPEEFSLSKDVRHRKVIDLLDHQGFKPLNELKDDPDFAELNWLSHFRLTNAIKAFGRRNHVSMLRSTGVPLPTDVKMGRAPFDYIECVQKNVQRLWLL